MKVIVGLPNDNLNNIGHFIVNIHVHLQIVVLFWDKGNKDYVAKDLNILLVLFIIIIIR